MQRVKYNKKFQLDAEESINCPKVGIFDTCKKVNVLEIQGSIVAPPHLQ